MYKRTHIHTYIYTVRNNFYILPNAKCKLCIDNEVELRIAFFYFYLFFDPVVHFEGAVFLSKLKKMQVASETKKFNT